MSYSVSYSILNRLGITFLAILLAACVITSCQPGTSSSSPLPPVEEVIIDLPTNIPSESTPEQQNVESTKAVKVTVTPKSFSLVTPTRTMVTSLPTKTKDLTCPGAPKQRVKVGEYANVCTKKDKLLVRKAPYRSSLVVGSLATGVTMKIKSGPVCDADWSYWEIEIGGEITGWVSEGGDEEDAYFICPNPKP